MKLKIMEWNIHQQGRQYKNGKSIDGEIPLWIVDEIPKDINIVVFTEFNCNAHNILKFYNSLENKGFCYSTTQYMCAWSNDILIAIRGDEIVVKSVSYVKAYPDTPNTTFNINWECIPENLRVDINVSEKDIHLWGIRIKDLQGNYEKRKSEMEMVMNWLKAVKGINMVVGDFNNLRENTPQKYWNLSILDELLLKADFERITPSNHSWGVSQSKSDNSFDGFIKNDHLICSKENSLKVTVKPYEWGYLCKSNYSLDEPAFNKHNLKIPVGEPDHGILFGEFEL